MHVHPGCQSDVKLFHSLSMKCLWNIMMLRQMINETDPEGVQSHALCKAMPSYSRDNILCHRLNFRYLMYCLAQVEFAVRSVGSQRSQKFPRVYSTSMKSN